MPYRPTFNERLGEFRRDHPDWQFDPYSDDEYDAMKDEGYGSDRYDDERGMRY